MELEVKSTDDEDSWRTDEVIRAREVLDGVQRSLLDRYERRALCPRLPLVIAKPRRARFSPFLSLPLSSLLSSSPSSVQPPLRLYLYPVDLASLTLPLSNPSSALSSSQTRLDHNSTLSLSFPTLFTPCPLLRFLSSQPAFPTYSFPRVPRLRVAAPSPSELSTVTSNRWYSVFGKIVANNT